MDTSPIPGFITRKQAAERCERAERSLQRYWSKAIELQDRGVLDNLKLRTEDGKTIDGPDVTKDLIEKLKKASQNPTWFVNAAWAAETYGPRETETDDSKDDKGQAVETDVGQPPTSDGTPAVESALRERIAALERHNEVLTEQLRTKDEQIKQASVRDSETTKLMQSLHIMIADWQGLPGPGGQPNGASPGRRPRTQEMVVVDPPKTQGDRAPASAKPTATKQRSGVSKKAPPRKRKAAAPTGAKAKKPAKGRSKKPRWYEVPTLKRFLSR